MRAVRKHYPIRTCISCGEKRVKKDLLRLVSDCDGLLKPDYRGVLPGRGAYVCEREECRRRAAHDRVLGKAFRMKGPFICWFRSEAQ